MSEPAFDRVFRNMAPAGYKGRLCRLVQREGAVRDRNGHVVYSAGTETVVVQFEGGESLRCIRSAVVPVASKLGRQTLANVARGGRRPSTVRRPTHAMRVYGIKEAACGERQKEGEKPLQFVNAAHLATCPKCHKPKT